MPRPWEEALAPKHRVTLSVAERDELTTLLRKGKAAARTWAPARLLLQVDESGSGPGGTDEQTACALHLSTRPLERGRERLVEQGWAAALLPQPSTRRHERAFDGAQAAPLLALAGRQASGRPGALDATLARRASGGVADGRHGLSRERASGAPKNEHKPPRRKRGCLPPKPSAEFVYHREDGLAVSQQGPDPQRPVVCVAETFRPLIGAGRASRPLQPGAVERSDSV